MSRDLSGAFCCKGKDRNAAVGGGATGQETVISGREIIVRVPWTARRSNQSTLTEISSEYSLEGLMLKLKLQYFGHLMQRTDSLEKTLMQGKIEAGGEGDDRG